MPIEADTPLHLAPVNMSYNSFDELEEDAAQDDELEAREKPAIISGAHCSARLAPGLKAGAIGPLGTGPGNFLAKMTTSRLCHWMSSNWASRDSNFSSIDVRECLPSMYHNTKNIVKTIKVRVTSWS